jgi:hypothetical protein
MVTLLAGLIVSVIGSLAAAVVSIITALRVGAVKEQASANTGTILELAKSTAKIEGHVNSEKTAAEGREYALRVENTLLRERIVEHQQTAALLAQATANRRRPSLEPLIEDKKET